MSLGFLIPDCAAERLVCARSPMERSAVHAGARLERREGWSLPESYGEPAPERARLLETVGFADRSNLAKLELQAEPRTLARIVAQASGGFVLEPTIAARSRGVWWCPVTPARVLAFGEPGSGGAALEELAQATECARGTTTLVDQTCGLAALSLVGPGARELLARFCAIDVRPSAAPVAAFRPGSVARTPGYVLVEAEDRLLVLVGWALGEYLWRVVADAAAHLGGGPVGAAALGHHMRMTDA